MSIHPTAVIDPAADIGASVSIGPFCRIDADVRVGDGCRLDGSVTLCRFTELGEDCHVHTGAVLGGTPQDLKFDPATVSHVRIGARSVIREGVTVHRGTGEGTATSIGEGCFLMANSHVGHNSMLEDGVILVNGALLAGHVTIGRGAIISGNSTIHQFCRVGRLAMISGLAGVSKDLPPFFVARSASVNRVSGINTVGLRRAGVSGQERTELKRAYRMLYLSGQTVTDAVRSIRAELHSECVGEICDFIESSKRGICGHARQA